MEILRTPRLIAKFLVIIPAYLAVNSAFAALDLPDPSFGTNVNTNEQMGFFPWPFRATGWGLAGNRNVGIGDAMLPLYGNDYGMFYGDAQVKYAADANWVDSFGGGYRYVYNCARIFGVYVFADHNAFKNVNANASSFWMVSPGIESMGNIWDFRVNGYIPVSSQTESKSPLFGDQLGLPNATVFQGHSQFGQLYTLNNNVGPGIDGEIGYAFPILHRTPRFYLGGYYFSPKNTGNIRGISGRLEFPLNHYFALTAADTYDNNVNNSFEAGLRVTIGGNTDDQVVNDIARRIVDPIQRNLATLSQGTGAPVTTNTTADGLALERSNIFFFSAGAGSPAAPLLGATLGASNFNPAAGTNNCTAENPCSGTAFTQATINSINSFAPNANFYLNTGVYSLGGQMFLNNGQSIYGRTLDFTSAASGLNQPQLFGGLLILSNNTLDSFTLLNNSGAQTAGITVRNANNNVFNNLNVGVFNGNEGYHTGIEIDNSSLTLTNSSINAFASDAANAAAIANVLTPGDVHLILRNDTLNTALTLDGLVAFGIEMQPPGSGDAFISMTDSRVNTNNTSAGGGGLGSTSGISIINQGNINLLLVRDNFSINQDSPQGSAAFAVNITSAPTDPSKGVNILVNARDSIFNVNADSDSGASTASPFSNTLLTPLGSVAHFNNRIVLFNDSITATVDSPTQGGFTPIVGVFLFSSGPGTISNIIDMKNTAMDITSIIPGTGGTTIDGIFSFVNGDVGNNLITINNSRINVAGIVPTGNQNASATGVFAQDTSAAGVNSVTIGHSILNVLASVDTGVASAQTVALVDLANPAGNQFHTFTSIFSATQIDSTGTHDVSPAIFINGQPFTP